MKSLNNYISEGIYGNLGISDDIDKEILKEWIVDNYYPSVNNGLRSKEIIVGDKDGNPVINTGMEFQINTDPKYNVAPDGVLPECCKNLVFNKPISHIVVKSDKHNPFRSFSNLPKCLHTDTVPVMGGQITPIALCGDYDTLDFGISNQKSHLHFIKIQT